MGNHFGDATRRVVGWVLEQATLLLFLVYGIVMLAIAPLWVRPRRKEMVDATHPSTAQLRHA